MITQKQVSQLVLTDKLFQIDYVEEYWSFKLNKTVVEKHSFKHALPIKIDNMLEKDIPEKVVNASLHGIELTEAFSKMRNDLYSSHDFDANVENRRGLKYIYTSFPEILQCLVKTDGEKKKGSFSDCRVKRISLHIADNIVFTSRSKNSNSKIDFANLIDDETEGEDD